MNNSIRQILICGFSLVILAAGAGVARACMCGPSPTVDKEYDRHEIVAIFKVVSTSERQERTADEEQPRYPTVKQIKFSVEKVFKGALKPGEEVILRQAAFGCVKNFDEASEGKDLLVYLTSDPNKDAKWFISPCSRSTDLEWAAADLLYLEKLSKVLGKTRLSGTIKRYYGAGAEGETTRWETMAHSPLLITGKGKTVRLKTDEHGAYEVYDLAPGKYRITPVRIRGHSATESGYEDVEIKKGGHTENNFIFSIDNAIRGRVLDSRGRGVPDVTVELVPARGKRPDALLEESTTEKGGRFAFTSVPAGSYLIVVNGGGRVTATSPFGKFYYPGTSSRGEASPVSIGPGQFINNLVLTAPKTAETVMISGVVLYEDGKPAADTIVNFYKDGEEEDEREINDDEDRGEDGYLRARLDHSDPTMEITDAQGRFSLKILKGQAGRIEATQFIAPGEYLDCAKAEKIVRDMVDSFASTNRPGVTTTYSAYIPTQPTRLEATGDQTGIELRFPFPFCRKKE